MMNARRDKMADKPKPNRRTLNAVKESLLKRESGHAKSANYFIQDEVFTRGRKLPIPRQSFRTPRPTIMAFADDAPLFNWGHPCRYLLHDAESAEFYQEIPAQFPPYASEGNTPKTFYAFHEPVTFPVIRSYPLRPHLVLRPRFFGSRYAILFSGMSNNRHTNDLEFLYRTLREEYSVPGQNIYVLNHDGTVNYDGSPQPVTHWPGDGSAYSIPVHGQGSRTDLLAVMDDLKKRLDPNDSLLIHTNNHGGHNGTESDLCCYPNWDRLGVAEFTDKLAELPLFSCLMVMMEQCHSGGFNSAVIAKSTASFTSIASACEELRNSIGGPDFDPFARDWISAMTGSDPYGHALQYDSDVNNDGRVSAREAFDYANAIHDPYDTPVFDDVNNGSRCWLGQDLIFKFPFPPILVEQITRKYWPEPDPLLLQERVKAVLPEIEALDEEFQPRMKNLQEEYEQRVTEIIKSVKRLR
jgi:hypothetical protein